MFLVVDFDWHWARDGTNSVTVQVLCYIPFTSPGGEQKGGSAFLAGIGDSVLLLGKESALS